MLPGQSLRTDLWQDGATVRFRSYAGDGDGGRLVLDNGLLRLREEGAPR